MMRKDRGHLFHGYKPKKEKWTEAHG